MNIFNVIKKLYGGKVVSLFYMHIIQVSKHLTSQKK
jgi:hypothetical protein